MGHRAIKVAAVAVTAGATAAAAVAAAKTARLAPESLPSRRDGHHTTVRGITINRPRTEVYDFWRDLTRLAPALGRGAATEVIDERRSRWSFRGPAGTTARYTAEIVDEAPGRMLSWQVTDGPVPHEGRVEFADAPGDRGTEVRLNLRYDLPAGVLGAAAAKLTGDEPDQVVRDSLRRVKQLLECGEVIVVDDQPTGRGPAREGVTRVVQHRLSTGGRP